MYNEDVPQFNFHFQFIARAQLCVCLYIVYLKFSQYNFPGCTILSGLLTWSSQDPQTEDSEGVIEVVKEGGKTRERLYHKIKTVENWKNQVAQT